MKVVADILLVLGVLSLSVAAINVFKAPNIGYLVGTFLPGMALLIIGLKLRQNEKPKPGPRVDSDGAEADTSDSDQGEKSTPENSINADFGKYNAIFGIGCGMLLMFLGSSVSRLSPSWFMIGTFILFGGWAWMIWGCVNYMRWKGYSGWFGLFGYLLLPGIIILACFPDRRGRLITHHEPENLATREAISKQDKRSGWRFVLTLAPLALLFTTVGVALYFMHKNVDSAQWKKVAPSGLGFQALMPGTPEIEDKTQETPSGKIKIHKFCVKPKNTKELFMIVSIQLPEELSREISGAEELLEVSRKDILSASQGKIKSEKPLILSGCKGLEMELLPPEGAIIKVRTYATNDRVYQVSVHVSKFRLASDDVEKFFESFQLLAKPSREDGSLSGR